MYLECKNKKKLKSTKNYLRSQNWFDIVRIHFYVNMKDNEH